MRGTHVNADAEIEIDVVTDPLTEPAASLAFDDWYRSEYRAVVGLVYSLSGSRGAAEEIAQDAFLEAHKRWGELSAYDEPGGWVRKVAMNRARSRFRRRAAEARAYARHVGRTRPLPGVLSEPSDEFWAAVRALPEQQAKVVALHYLEDRPVDEIASILGIAEGTVKTHLHRGRATLAARLTNEELT